jgi:hypothetical protein
MTTKKSAGLDWLTEDENTGPDIPQEVTDEKQPRRGRFGIYALVLLGIGLLALGAYRQMNRRSQGVYDDVVAEVLLAHELIEQAARRNDRELFLTLLGAGDGRWLEGQRKVFDQKLFLDRTPLGLQLETDSLPAGSFTKPQVSVTADLTLAEVTSVYRYLVELAPGTVESIHLERTLFYAREGNTWAYVSPPDEESFWGSWLREESDQLLVLFSARDEQVGYRLYADLQSLVHEICQDALVRCPPDYKLRLRLSRDPASLQQVNGLLDMYPSVAGQDLELPAPSLVGTPLDEIGYEALYRGYAGWVAAAVVSHFNSDGFFSYDLLSEQLARWQLRPPPLPGYQVDRAAAVAVTYPEQDVALLCVSDLDTTLIRLDLGSGKWQDELAGKLSLPRDNYATLSRLADGSDILLTYRAIGDSEYESWRTLQWRQGLFQLLFEETTPYQVLNHSLTPGGSYLLLRIEENGPSFKQQLLNLESCLENDCELFDVADLGAWSPDGNQTLALVNQEAGTTLYLADGKGQNPEPLYRDGVPFWIAQPFWLDDQTFAYMRSPVTVTRPAPGDLEVVIAAINSDGPAMVLTTVSAENLVGAAPLRRQGEQLFLLYALANPRQSGQIVLVAAALKDSQAGLRLYYFSFNYQAETSELLYEVDYTGFEGGVHSRFSRNGRYLVTAGYKMTAGGRGATEMLLHLYNQDSQQTWSSAIISAWRSPEAGQYDWSADGEWLLIGEPGMIRLLAPGENYEEFIFHRFQGCDQVAWVKG